MEPLGETPHRISPVNGDRTSALNHTLNPSRFRMRSAPAFILLSAKQRTLRPLRPLRQRRDEEVRPHAICEFWSCLFSTFAPLAHQTSTTPPRVSLAPKEEFDFEVPPGDFDIIITDRRTGAQQVERVRVGRNESVALDISPEA
jgi:hypothetical protein